jgi:hypothetical protein
VPVRVDRRSARTSLAAIAAAIGCCASCQALSGVDDLTFAGAAAAAGGAAGKDAGPGGAGSGGGAGLSGSGGTSTGGSGGVKDGAPGLEYLLTNAPRPLGIHVDEGQVYFASNATAGAVYRCAKTGCQGSAEAVAPAQMNPRKLSMSGSTLVWSNGIAGASLRSCALPSCSTITTFGPEQTDHVATSETTVFFSHPSSGGGVGRCRLDGSDCFPTLLADQGTVGGIAYDVGRDKLYWTSTTNGRLYACSPYSCSQDIALLLSNHAGASALATDGVHLFFAYDATASAVMRAEVECLPTGCSVAQLETLTTDGGDRPRPIVADPPHVYWLTDTAELRRCSIAGCVESTVLAPAMGTPGAIAVDDTHVYFTVVEPGLVLRVPK